jgi:hypothetical protein
MPQFLEDKLKRQYGADSAIPYKIMNSRGLMRGNKETPKGAALQAKHDRDMQTAKRPRLSPAAADKIRAKADRLMRR